MPGCCLAFTPLLCPQSNLLPAELSQKAPLARPRGQGEDEELLCACSSSWPSPQHSRGWGNACSIAAGQLGNGLSPSIALRQLLLQPLCVWLCSAGPCSLPVVNGAALMPGAPSPRGPGDAAVQDPVCFSCTLPTGDARLHLLPARWLLAPGSPPGEVASHRHCLAGIGSTI